MVEDLNCVHIRYVHNRLHSSNVPALNALVRRPFQPRPMTNQTPDENIDLDSCSARAICRGILEATVVWRTKATTLEDEQCGVVEYSADLPFLAISRLSRLDRGSFSHWEVVCHAMITPVNDQKPLLIPNETTTPHDRERDPSYLLPHCWRLQDCYSCLHSQYHCSWCAIVRTLNTPPHEYC